MTGGSLGGLAVASASVKPALAFDQPMCCTLDGRECFSYMIGAALSQRGRSSLAVEGYSSAMSQFSADARFCSRFCTERNSGRTLALTSFNPKMPVTRSQVRTRT